MPDPLQRAHVHITYKTPETEEEWQAYYDLRWQILRAPWHQPRGSERDDLETQAYHVMAISRNQTIGVGRLHQVNANSAQIRYMAVETDYRGRGIGHAILSRLENEAGKRQFNRIVLNARSSTLKFYLGQGYIVTGAAPRLFGCIEHSRMEKNI